MTYNYNYDLGRREAEIIVRGLDALIEKNEIASDVADAKCLRHYLMSLCEVDKNGVILGFKKSPYEFSVEDDGSVN